MGLNQEDKSSHYWDWQQMRYLWKVTVSTEESQQWVVSTRKLLENY